VAGIVTAIGALGIILAIGSRGSPLYVMPLVFGIAPVVNSFVTIHFARAYKHIGPIFIAGLILVLVGSITVLLSTPRPNQSVTMAIADGSPVKATVVSQMPDGSKDTKEYSAPTLEEFQKQYPPIYQLYRSSIPLSATEWALVIAFTLMTALCWGVYGPTLHKGQMAMAGSRLRPLLLVGLSYFLVAVLLPFLLLAVLPATNSLVHGDWSTGGVGGVMWSLAGGAAGAIGALGVIMAFNSGGKPIYVMPLIFGGAPVINTLVVLAQKGAFSHIGPIFIAGLMLVAAGAVTVLIFAPRAPAHAPASEAVAKPLAAPVSPAAKV